MHRSIINFLRLYKTKDRTLMNPVFGIYGNLTIILRPVPQPLQPELPLLEPRPQLLLPLQEELP